MDVFNRILQEANEKAANDTARARVAQLAMHMYSLVADNDQYKTMPACDVVEACGIFLASGLSSAFASSILAGDKTLADYDNVSEAILKLYRANLDDSRRLLALIAVAKKGAK
jgi:hypothetical protein